MFTWCYALALKTRASLRSTGYLILLWSGLSGGAASSAAFDGTACRQALNDALRERAASRRSQAEPPPGHPERMVPGPALSDGERWAEAELRPRWWR